MRNNHEEYEKLEAYRYFVETIQRTIPYANNKQFQDSMQRVYQRLNFVPAEAWKKMAGLAEETWQNVPANLYLATKQLFVYWKKGNPETFKPRHFCVVCKGNGFYSAVKLVPEYFHDQRTGEAKAMPIRVTILCSACENWIRVFGPQAAAGFCDNETGQYIKLLRASPSDLTDKHDFDAVETFSTPTEVMMTERYQQQERAPF